MQLDILVFGLLVKQALLISCITWGLTPWFCALWAPQGREVDFWSSRGKKYILFFVKIQEQDRKPGSKPAHSPSINLWQRRWAYTMEKKKQSLARSVKNLPATHETWVWSLGQEDLWKRGWLPTPVFLTGEFHGQRSLAGNTIHRVKKSRMWLSN